MHGQKAIGTFIMFRNAPIRHATPSFIPGHKLINRLAVEEAVEEHHKPFATLRVPCCLLISLTGSGRKDNLAFYVEAGRFDPSPHSKKNTDLSRCQQHTDLSPIRHADQPFPEFLLCEPRLQLPPRPMKNFINALQNKDSNMMDNHTNKEQIPYLLALLYTVIGILLIFAYYIVYSSENQTWLLTFLLGFIPSAVVAIIAFPVVYFFFKRQGIHADSEGTTDSGFAATLRENIAELNQVLHTSRIGSPTLRKRNAIPLLSVHAKDAREIYISAIAGASIASANLGFFRERIIAGCRINVILLNPESPALDVWNMQRTHKITKKYIESSLDTLGQLVNMQDVKGYCEIRLINTFLSHSYFAVNPDDETGTVVVEFYAFKMDVDKRLHFFLERDHHYSLFEYYNREFTKVSNDAIQYRPTESP
jgi:hypothetical protein